MLLFVLFFRISRLNIAVICGDQLLEKLSSCSLFFLNQGKLILPTFPCNSLMQLFGV